jgi:predicted phage terminase large subunit-like protein
MEEALKRNLSPDGKTALSPYYKGVEVGSLSEYHEYLRLTLPKGWDSSPPHIKLICEHLDAIDRGEIDRLAVSMPPRHGKTETITVRYGAYCFEREPDENVLVTAYNERIARRFSRKARAIVSGRRALMESSKAQDEWGMPEGGTFMSRGVGSPPTGVGFKHIIIDDPIRSREDAESVNSREKAWDWYTDDIYTRLEPGGAMIIVATRWHHDDIISRAIDSEPNRWTVLKLPALADEPDDPLGRNLGEALWPDRYPVEALERIRSVQMQNEGEYSWLALYQQTPTQRTGSFIKQDKITIMEHGPDIAKLVRAWDLASVKGSGDYTVGIKAALDKQGRFWILDLVRGQFDVEERDDLILRTTIADGREATCRLPQDPAQAGRSQAKYLLKMLHGFKVSIHMPSGSKIVRAEALVSQINHGNVYMVKAKWNNEVLDEMRMFPMGRHDDVVDAVVDAYDEVVRRRTMQAV